MSYRFLILGILVTWLPGGTSLHAQQLELPCIRVTDAELSGGATPFGVACSRDVAESSMRSTDGDATSVTFVNRRSTPVHLYWINYSGRRVFYALIPPDQTHEQQTYVTHPWLITNEGGDPLAAFMPERSKGLALIR